MLLTELSGWDSPDAAVWADLVVVTTPGRDLRASLLQCLESTLVQALIPEAPVEALDVAVLQGTTWLNEDVSDPMVLRPCDEGLARELGPVVGSHSSWVATKPRRLIWQPDPMLAADAVVHRDVHGVLLLKSSATVKHVR